jgi:polar amino acid transport system substrate-binding protein
MAAFDDRNAQRRRRVKRMGRAGWRFACCGLLLASAAPMSLAQQDAAGPVFKIARVDYVAPSTEIAQRVMHEAFNRLGIVHEFVRLPPLRAINAANDGEADADVVRIADAAKGFPNLMAVPTPICQVDVAVYGRDHSVAELSRGAIEKLGFAVTRGTFVLAKYSRGLRSMETQTNRATAEVLMSDRVDAAMLIYLDAEVELRKLYPERFVPWPYFWASEPQYFLINKKHAALVPKLDAVLRQMDKEGLIRKSYLEGFRQAGVIPLLPADAAPR